MSDVHIRPVRTQELGAFLGALQTSFGNELEDGDVERYGRVLEAERTHAAFDGELIVGTAGAYTFDLTVPGGELPAAGVTMVGVNASHRRRGILSRMMRAQLDDVRNRGEPLAILFASEGVIYQRFGYGLGTLQGAIDIEREWTGFRDDSRGDGRARLLGFDEAVKVLPGVYERVRTVTPGMFSRSESWWEAHRLHDGERDRRGGGPMFRAVWEQDGRPEAYALYRMHHDWPGGVPAGHVEVIENVATTPEATREIWRFLFGIDLAARLKSYFQPADHPLLLMLVEPRRLRLRVDDGLWLRVVDVKRALEGRSYAARGSLVFELVDPFCEWNSGTWRLHVGGSGAAVERSSDPAELRVAAQDLAAVYLGALTFAQHLRAGVVRELVPGAAARADELFRTDRTPFCPEVF
jgi:predicted acetyltransferase